METGSRKYADEENVASFDFLGFTSKKFMSKGGQDSLEVSSDEVEEANAMAKELHVYKPGITFVNGALLEVLDIRDNNWYQCKVVEVDWGELDILVHYQRWSQRFDEWLKMDSNRLRPYVARKVRKMHKKQGLRLGEKVLAKWAPDGKNYQAKVTKIIDEHLCEVLFYDGITKTIKIPNIFRLESKSDVDSSLAGMCANNKGLPKGKGTNEIEPNDLSKAGPSVEADQGNKKSIFEVQILEQKRKSKRKAEVEELFQNMKKKRKIYEDSVSYKKLPSPSTKPVNPLKTSPVRPTVERKSSPVRSNVESKTLPVKSNESKTSETELESTSVPQCESPLPSTDLEHLEFDIGNGWLKYCSKRLTGTNIGRWDVYYVGPTGKKLRSKTELMKYVQYLSSDVDLDDFDFSVKCVRDHILTQMKLQKPHKKASMDDDNDDKVETKTCPDVDDRKSKVSHKKEKIKEELETSNDDIKKEEMSDAEDSFVKDSLNDSSDDVKPGTSSSLNAGKPPLKLLPVTVPILLPNKELLRPSIKPHLKIPIKKEFVKDEPSFQVAHNEHVCPKEGCGKSFRKGNLLQMHIKHYHPQLFKKAKVCVPNVADLAYARTVGGHLDHHSPSNCPSATIDSPMPKKPRPSFSYESRDRKMPSSKLDFVLPQNKSVKDSKKKEPKESKKEVKVELDDYLNDLEEEYAQAVSLAEADPDYIPGEDDKRRKDGSRRERRREKFNEGRITRKRKSLHSESMSDDEAEVKFTPLKPRSIRKKGIPKGIPEASNVETISTSKKYLAKEENIEVEEEPADTLAEITEAASVVDTSNEIINCGCGSTEEEGLMLLCDVCLCWQHGACYNINNEDQVPEKYICSLCDNPKYQRSSFKFRHHQDWLKEGRLPKFSFAVSANDSRLASSVQRGHELTANICQLDTVMHSLRLKLHMAKLSDHPKFVMWHKKWVELESQRDTNEMDKDMSGTMDVMNALQQLMNIDNTLPLSDVNNGYPMLNESLQNPPNNALPTIKENVHILDDDNSLIQEKISTTEKENMLPPSFQDTSIIKSENSCLSKNDQFTELETKTSLGMNEYLMNTSQSECSQPVNSIGTNQSENTKECFNHTFNSELNGNLNDFKETNCNMPLKGNCDEDANNDTHLQNVKPESKDTEERKSEIGTSKNMTDIKNGKDSAVISSEREIINADPIVDLKTDKPFEDKNTAEENSNPKENNETKLQKDLDNKSDICDELLSLHEKSNAVKLQDKDVSSDYLSLDNKLPNIDPSDVASLATESWTNDENSKKFVENPSHHNENPSTNNEILNKDYSEKTMKIHSTHSSSALDHLALMSAIDSKKDDPFGSSNIGQKDLDEILQNENTNIKSGSGVDDSIDPEDDLDIDLGGLGGSGSGPNDLAALLSSQTDLERLISQEGPELNSLVAVQDSMSAIMTPHHPVAAPIIPEAERIEPVNCKLNLLEDVQHVQKEIDSRFDEIEKQLELLEVEMGLAGEPFDDGDDLENESRDASTLQARDLVKLIVGDLSTIQKIAQFTS